MRRFQFDQAIETHDLLDLKQHFPTRKWWNEMQLRMQRAVDAVHRNPLLGRELSRRLTGHFRYKWESAGDPDWPIWPDMRLIYRMDNVVITLLAVGRRDPHQVDDVYTVLQRRIEAFLA